MKKLILLTATMSTMLIAGLSSCENNKQKTEEAEADVAKATTALAKAQLKAETDSMKMANLEEWKLFKNEMEGEIKTHEIRIAFLRKSIQQSKPKEAKALSERISILESTNLNLKTRLEIYNKVQNDWQEFKNEFKEDMDHLRMDLKNFTD
jgi:Tfp pilus assembly protein PilN